jgi:hypothetical protein
MSIEEAAQWLVMMVVVPMWIAAGTFDWLCHRSTRIQHTSGLPENVFHWLLLAEGGIALVAVAFLEVNAGVMLLVFAAFLVHECTTYVELRYTVPLREVRPIEQMIHSFMEILPLAMLMLLAVMRWDQADALFGGDTPDFDLRPKAEPWPASYLLGAGVAVLLLNIVPLAEESLRCLRAPRRS